MKKILVSLVLALTVVASVAAQQTNSIVPLAEDTPVKIEINRENYNPKLYGAVNNRKKDLGKIENNSELVLPAGTSKLVIGKTGKTFDCTDLKIDDTLYIEAKNPGLAGLGAGLSFAGGMLLGAGLGFGLMAVMENDTGALKDFALGTGLPGLALTAGGLVLNLNFRTTISKK